MLFFHHLYRRDDCLQRRTNSGHLGVIPLFLALTFVASPAIKLSCVKLQRKQASTQSLLVEALSGVQTIMLKTPKTLFAGVGSAATPRL